MPGEDVLAGISTAAAMELLEQYEAARERAGLELSRRLLRGLCAQIDAWIVERQSTSCDLEGATASLEVDTARIAVRFMFERQAPLMVWFDGLAYSRDAGVPLHMLDMRRFQHDLAALYRERWYRWREREEHRRTVQMGPPSYTVSPFDMSHLPDATFLRAMSEHIELMARVMPGAPRAPGAAERGSPEQLRQFEREGQFEVIGSHSRRRYLLTQNASFNVLELDDYGVAAFICFAPRGHLVMGDVLLAQKIALENDEQGALGVANVERRRAPGAGDPVLRTVIASLEEIRSRWVDELVTYGAVELRPGGLNRAVLAERPAPAPPEREEPRRRRQDPEPNPNSWVARWGRLGRALAARPPRQRP